MEIDSTLFLQIKNLRVEQTTLENVGEFIRFESKKRETKVKLKFDADKILINLCKFTNKPFLFSQRTAELDIHNLIITNS